MKKGILALSNGSLFYGRSVGIEGCVVGELIFNTSMTGYQEILTDPSYYHQIITFTAPHIGNVGINQQDMESARIWASGVIMRELAATFSHWRGQKSVGDFLRQQNIVALTEIDTRRLTHIIREQGNLAACIISDKTPVDFALQQARSFAGIKNNNLAHCVTTSRIKKLSEKNNRFHIVVIDCGVKTSMLNYLQQLACDLSIVPATISFAEISAMKPDGILLSNGPGDPTACQNLIALTQKILAAQLPLFAICLGHQILALACGAKIYKMQFGQHGANHPIYDRKQKNVLITTQNHNYAVSSENLPNNIVITHHSLFDGSIAGLICAHAPAFSFQGHPEAGPGPQDSTNMFTQFIRMIEKQHAETH